MFPSELGNRWQIVHNILSAVLLFTEWKIITIIIIMISFLKLGLEGYKYIYLGGGVNEQAKHSTFHPVSYVGLL